MRDNLFKKIIITVYYRPNTTHYILVGPMRGMIFRIDNVTQLTPLYSGNERWHQKRFKELIEKNQVVIDIGANWGLHTLYTSKLVGKAGKVIAIEPFPSAFNKLKWHIERNSCTNVVPFNIAISDSNGEIQMLSKPNDGQGIMSNIIKDNTLFTDKNTVTAKTLDTLAKELTLKKIHLIKIDIEGAEDKVLKGAKITVEKFRPYFIIDSHNPVNDVFIGKWFSERDYKLKRVNPFLPPILDSSIGWPNKNGVWGSLLAIP